MEFITVAFLALCTLSDSWPYLWLLIRTWLEHDNR